MTLIFDSLLAALLVFLASASLVWLLRRRLGTTPIWPRLLPQLFRPLPAVASVDSSAFSYPQDDTSRVSLDQPFQISRLRSNNGETDQGFAGT